MTEQSNAYPHVDRLKGLTLLIGLLVAPASARASEPFDPEQTVYYLCAGCHGPEPGSVLYPMPPDIPVLTGQKRDYLFKQLVSYRDGRREHPNMSGPLINYTDENLRSIATYYEGLGPARPVRAAPRPAPKSQPVATSTPPTKHPASKKAPHPRSQKSTRKAPSSSNVHDAD